MIAYGHLEKGDPRTPNDDTIFEIGSATKIFTPLLLADMVQRGKVELSDPVAKYLPPFAKMPERNGRSITLVDLATQDAADACLCLPLIDYVGPALVPAI